MTIGRKFAMGFLGTAVLVSMTACSGASAKIKDTAVTQTKAEASEVGNVSADTIETGTPEADAAEEKNCMESMEVISVYSGNNDATGPNRAMDAVPELTAQAVVDKLIEYGVLEKGTSVIDFTIAEKIGYLDLSSVPSSGTAGELIMLTAVGNTFTENFELEKVKLLVKGENYSSGHIIHEDDDFLEYDKGYKKLG